MTKKSVHVCNCPALEILIEKYSNELPVGDKVYFELPFWFEKEPSGMVMYFKPPADLKEAILKAGLGNPNQQKIKKVQ